MLSPARYAPLLRCPGALLRCRGSEMEAAPPSGQLTLLSVPLHQVCRGIAHVQAEIQRGPTRPPNPPSSLQIPHHRLCNAGEPRRRSRKGGGNRTHRRWVLRVFITVGSGGGCSCFWHHQPLHVTARYSLLFESLCRPADASPANLPGIVTSLHIHSELTAKARRNISKDPTLAQLMADGGLLCHRCSTATWQASA